MKRVKKALMLGLSLVLTMSMLTGCGTKEDSATMGKDGAIKIGVSQFVTHDALDASYKGFVDGLGEAGYVDGENIKIDYQNASGDQSNCTTIAQKLVTDDNDLILAIATNAAQACANATSEIPILITAVTDPEATGLVESNEAPGGNVSGTSDLTPVAEQMKLLKRILPEAKKVAILYCSSEVNSQIQAEMAVKEAENLGLEAVHATVSASTEIQQVIESLIDKVDAIYAPTDNMIASGMATVAMIANENNLPVIVGEEGMLSEGGLATYGINYYELGKQTAAQAVKIIENKAKIESMPIEYINADNVKLKINEEIATQLGVTFPDDVLAEAKQ